MFGLLAALAIIGVMYGGAILAALLSDGDEAKRAGVRKGPA